MLRDYQREAIDDVRSRWREGARRVPIVLATGLGKTFIFTHLAREWLAEPENAGQRVLIIAHTDELIQQAFKDARNIIDGRRIGIVQGQQYNNVTAHVIVSSRQTLAREKRRAQIKNVGLIIIDECHHAHEANTYGAILKHFKALPLEKGDPAPEGGPLVLGVTATLVRGDKAKLSTVWEDCTFKRDMMFGIRHGYLTDVRGEQIIVPDFDLRQVKSKGGDYDLADLGEELERTFAPEVIAEKYALLAADRRGVVFWPLVATAQHGAKAFHEAGISSEVVHGAMPKEQRKAIIKRHRAGDFQVLHNAMVLTEGYDDPGIEAVVIARNSKSSGLIQQMAGRGLRQPGGVPFAASRPCLLMVVASGDELPEYTFRALIDLSPERAKQVYDEHPDATLEELDEYAIAIEEELAEQRAGATYSFEAEGYRGATATRTFDPLQRDKAWGKTPGGTFYLKATTWRAAHHQYANRKSSPDAFAFVTPTLSGKEGAYDVVMCSINDDFNPKYDAAPPWLESTGHIGIGIDEALLLGEELAGQAFTTRRAAWRRNAPSAGLLVFARMLGVPVRAGMTAGELSEAIDLEQATRRIDPLVARVSASAAA